MALRIASVLFAAAMAASPAAGQSLGAASGFNLWTFGDAFLKGADAQGPVAIGGQATLDTFGVATGFAIPAPGAGLVVGGNLAFANGAVDNGSAYVAGSASGTFGVPNGTLHANVGAGGLPIDFAATNALLRANSLAWAAAAPTGTVANVFSTLTFTGANSGLNVFQIGSNQLPGITGLAFNVPAGATAFVNVAGASASFSALGVALNGLTRDRLLFNLPNATSLLVENISFQGSILAPNAALTHRSANIEGNVIVGSVGALDAPAGGEYHFGPGGFGFDGLTPVPEPAALALAGVALAGLLWRSRRRAGMSAPSGARTVPQSP